MDYHEQRVRLWKAVIVQAVTDSIYSGNYSFFNTKSKIFIFLCELAEIDSEWLSRKVKRFSLDNGDKNFTPSTSSPSFFDTRKLRGSCYKKKERNQSYFSEITYKDYLSNSLYESNSNDLDLESLYQ